MVFMGNKELKRIVVAMLSNTGKPLVIAQQLVFIHINKQAEEPLNLENTDNNKHRQTTA